jgi:hypothetical protein
MDSALPPDRSFLWINRLLLLAVALAGIAHVAFLPPFEGFDETNHFSYIQQIADTGTIPRYGIDKASSDVDSYPGPRHYSPSPPYDNVGGLTYRSFFNGSSVPSLTPEGGLAYRPGRSVNAEAQHPPLYYLLMAPVYLLAKSWSWPSAFLLLRLATWTLAFAGFVIGCRATQQALMTLKVSPRLCLLAALWPFLFAEFFPEMARIGNDGLCMLLMGIAWWLMLRLLADRRIGTALWLGLILGLGLLTKAFFVPILVGCAGLLCFHELRERDGRQIRNAAILLVSACVVGGGWYLYRYLTVGNFIVANDIMAVQQHGSVLTQIINSVGLGGVLRGIGQLTVSFAWAGTWSYGRFPPIFTLPVILLALLPLFNWLIKLRWAPTPVIAPLFVVTPMLLGLGYYMLTQIARGPAASGTPGWYLHIMAGPLSLALVMGWRQRIILAALAAYALAYHAVLWAMQLSLFSGCAFKAGDYKYTQFDLGNCFILPDRLAVLGEPLLGGLALAATIVAGIVAALRWRHSAAA